MDFAAEQNLKCVLTKIILNSRKNSESYKNVRKCFGKIDERLCFGKLLLSFGTVLGKFENPPKIFGKGFWTNFIQDNFSENVDQFSAIFQDILFFP